MKDMFKVWLLIGATVLSLSACSTISDMFPSVNNKVAALESSYTAAAHIATAYVNLPTCSGISLQLCKKQSVVIQIMAADNSAYLAIKAARAAEDETTLGAAQSAVDTLDALTSSVKVK